MNIIFPPAYNNEAAHTEVKQLMQQHKLLSIELDTEPNAWIATSGKARLRYRLNTDSWQWILRYLKSGDHEDFGVFPSRLTAHTGDFQLNSLQTLIEEKCNIARIPILRETPANVRLISIFDYGKIFFKIKRSNQLMDYLHEHNL